MAIIHHPPTLINAYLSEKLNELFYSGAPGTLTTPTVPLFPSMPTDIDALTETFPYSDGRFAVYDRMFKMRRKAFPYIKCEQVLYYFYAYGERAVPDIIEIAQTIQDFLDDGDQSAKEINYWVKTKLNANGLFPVGSDFIKPVYFHEFKIFQLEETRDIVDFGTARTYAGNKIIVDYEYHKTYPGQDADPTRPF